MDADLIDWVCYLPRDIEPLANNSELGWAIQCLCTMIER